MLKGPAAATLYGTEAARGVINIITKRGERRARPKYTFTRADGSQWFQDAAGRIRDELLAQPRGRRASGRSTIVKSEAANGTPLFRTGDITQLQRERERRRAASIGTSSSGEFSEAEGHRRRRTPARRRTCAPISRSCRAARSSIETSVGYLTSRTTTTGEGGSAGAIWGAARAAATHACGVSDSFKPAPRGCGWARGSIVSPPEVYAQTQNWQDVQALHRQRVSSSTIRSRGCRTDS